MYGYGMMNSGWGIIWGLLMMVMMIGSVLLAVLGITALIKYLKPTQFLSHTDSSPLEILKARYAKGEITSEEYNKIKTEIEKG